MLLRAEAHASRSLDRFLLPLQDADTWCIATFALSALRGAEHVTDAEKYLVAWSGFDQCDAKLIERICKALGAPSAESLSFVSLLLTCCTGIEATQDPLKATHVIFSGDSDGGVKAKQARAADIPIVDLGWLLNHIKAHPAPDAKPSRVRLLKSEDVKPRPLVGMSIAISKALAVRFS